MSYFYGSRSRACKHCGGEIKTWNMNRDFCSAKCKQKAYRLRLKLKKPVTLQAVAKSSGVTAMSPSTVNVTPVTPSTRSAAAGRTVPKVKRSREPRDRKK